ncbi:hypothetical protein BU23DRAFT_252829 [Bimuria novae-zelandiae CBS 107.79]|uniref:Uncharacterized protein n=1 Tax=Bimuria novae-zelandiae CBS 107.79 TaxID=1447943 RepID=A0A6A5VNV8_9PLEO|nr:hypothetical protein BU23DRAFT_252829 [Bimuria novae-zelandiae CBS 107.79]
MKRTWEDVHRKNSRIRQRTRGCNCISRKTHVTILRWPINVSRSSIQAHSTDYPYNAFEGLCMDVDMRLSICSTKLGRKFNLAAKVFYNSNTSNLHVSLRQYAVVDPEKSEAFALIHDLQWAIYTRPDDSIDVAMDLRELFETRCASPHERASDDGRTLLHVGRIYLPGSTFGDDTFSRNYAITPCSPIQMSLL